MRNLGKYVKKYGILYVVAIAAMVVSILLDAASPQITRHIIDDVIVGGRLELLMRLLLGLWESHFPVRKRIYFRLLGVGNRKQAEKGSL